MKRVFLITIVITWISGSFASVLFAGSPKQTAPSGLMVELLASPGQVSVDGERASTSLQNIRSLRQSPEFPAIRSSQPGFSWIVNDTTDQAMQSAYRILVASSLEQLHSDEGDVWDSGKTESDQSTAVRYRGRPLQPNTTYFWKVRTWNTEGEASPYSRVQRFRTGELNQEYATSYYPLEKEIVEPRRLTKVAPERYFVDFGKAAFGRVQLTLSNPEEYQQIIVHLGEVPAGADSIDRNPGGSRRYRSIPLALQQGTHTYTVRIPPDERNTGSNAIKMPEYTGEVLPFRYCEVEGYPGVLHPSQIRQIVVYYPFNEQASSFWSSSQVLNDVWELCKYSIKATSFTGIYIDGDRERIPYEADAYINQLCHYGVDREYTMARRSHEYLITNPTWPTEWIMHSVLMAWDDYMYTGDSRSLEQYYEDLEAKTLIPLEREDGLISTRTGLVTDEVLESIHFDGELRDIVDWPHTGILGLNEGEGGETDGYVFRDINTVVNAFHYRALVLMSRIADALGKQEDVEFYSQRAAEVKASFNEKLLDKSKGYYVDGEATDHSSLHANMFPLAFELVPEEYKDSVVQFIRSRGMACSVYGAQHLLDGLYEADAEDYALDLLTATDDRSWGHMVYELATTITTEAWDASYKPNMDWNHAWGAAPANIIPRRLVGVRPLEPGFEKILIQPQPGYLREFRATVPTIRGPVNVHYHREVNGKRQLKVDIPANTTARILLPAQKDVKMSLIETSRTPGSIQQVGEHIVLDPLDPGTHRIEY